MKKKVILGIVVVTIIGFIGSNVHLTKKNADVDADPYVENEDYDYDYDMLSGEYVSNRYASLLFDTDGSVTVSESGGSTRCSYDLDEDGNLTIYADSENLEGTYNAEQDSITLYGINYYRN